MGKNGVVVKIDREKCKGCMLCVRFCPFRVLEAAQEVNKRGTKYAVAAHPDKCTGCGVCYIMCPDCAVEITVVKNEEQKAERT